jgi:hypothetical protein
VLASKALLLGLLLGVRHAIEPDHLAAITTMIPDSGSAAGAARTGALWGLGHAIAIVIFGSILVAMGVTVPVKIAFVLEVVVAAMLVVLGIVALRGPQQARKGRSTLVGFVHGVSGTGAITLLCVTTLPSPRVAIAFLVLFAFGALLSMSAMSGLLAAPLTAIAKRGDRALRTLRTVGALSAFAAAVFVVAAAASGCDPLPAAKTSAAPATSASASASEEMAEPPYSAKQIREATKVGRRYEWRLELPGKPAVRKVISFTRVDDQGCDTRAEGLDDSGKPLAPAKDAHATWEELRAHALFPKKSVVLSDETITIPAGTFVCTLYTVTEGDEISRFWFAKELPGPPVQFSTEKGGQLMMKSTLLSYRASE